MVSYWLHSFLGISLLISRLQGPIKNVHENFAVNATTEKEYMLQLGSAKRRQEYSNVDPSLGQKVAELPLPSCSKQNLP